MAGKRVVELFGTKFIISRGPPWTYHKPKFPILKRYNLPKPYKPGPLGAQQAKMAEAAKSVRGQKDLPKVIINGVAMPGHIANMIPKLVGKTGGMTKEQRDQIRHKIADYRLQQYYEKARGSSAPKQPQAPSYPSETYYQPYY
ncbi:MAG: hypothetical protein ACPLVI_06080 [Thermoplasmata archaeon]